MRITTTCPAMPDRYISWWVWRLAAVVAGSEANTVARTKPIAKAPPTMLTRYRGGRTGREPAGHRQSDPAVSAGHSCCFVPVGGSEFGACGGQVIADGAGA